MYLYNIINNILKNKYYKYKSKYLNLIKQTGGSKFKCIIPGYYCKNVKEYNGLVYDNKLACYWEYQKQQIEDEIRISRKDKINNNWEYQKQQIEDEITKDNIKLIVKKKKMNQKKWRGRFF